MTDSMTGIYNVGSLNIDHVYGVDHIVRPGETVAGNGYGMFAGGKGGNQSAALARAGAAVSHVGCIGADGLWLREGLEQLGVDVSHITVDPETATGHAVIQVESDSGENAIFLYPGGNHRISPESMRAVFSQMPTGSIVLLQNEINATSDVIVQAANEGYPVYLNPAPFHSQVLDWPLDLVDVLIVNETEAVGLAQSGVGAEPESLIDALHVRWPRAEILLTLGERGAILSGPDGRVRTEAVHAGSPIDTTAAGDTFIGYFLAARTGGESSESCLLRAATAAGICVTRAGARVSIPSLDEVQLALGGN
ncbi:MAG: ribokinase [Candidatus Latescibacteria bacterium]|nr:ribokinase [Candidatus Latescibacterota bacterium]MDP7449033.1 ribokinase [Candidatus Latescibacterota bacterium]HJP32287.1 ribokinase [Candidatus Latescibacterota bacterium]